MNNEILFIKSDRRSFYLQSVMIRYAPGIFLSFLMKLMFLVSKH